MPGKTTIACTSEQYNTLITLIYEGVGNSIQPNPRVATALVVEANTGLRIGDILTLRLNDIIKDGNRYRFNITEKKTGKKRTFTVPNSVYDYLKEYCDKFEIGYSSVMFPITERFVQKHLAKICTIPIHSKIYDLVKKNYEKAISMNSEYLFNDEDGQQGTFLTYDKYRGRFGKINKKLHLSHRPHDTRHTFITKAKAAGVDEYILKAIVGHEIVDVTEKVYTHRTMEEFKREIEKIP